MSTDRLPTELWVQAHLRQLGHQAIPAYVVRKGDPRAGLLILKLNLGLPGCRVLSQSRDLDGALAWLPAKGGELLPEADADAYIARAVQRDPDLWVVEIEDREGRHPFEGRVLI
ncbi:DUF1491 family protein [Inquilinus sp. OTU3971]|uniref:DUF1491 family protein n=1 Tax=Inquilinus sp. OTU3971 TaxID=3043855 RepID=UPI00313B7CD7